MRTSDQNWKPILLSVSVIVLSLWILVQLGAGYGRRRMEAAIAVLGGLRLKETTLISAEGQMDKALSWRGQRTIDTDGDQEINYRILAPQGGLESLGHVFSLNITLGFDKSNRLASKKASFGGGSISCCAANVLEIRALPSIDPMGLDVPRYDPYSIIIHLGAAASPADYQAAWQWQFSCLTSFVGCRDARGLLPLIRPRTPHHYNKIRG